MRVAELQQRHWLTSSFFEAVGDTKKRAARSATALQRTIQETLRLTCVVNFPPSCLCPKSDHNSYTAQQTAKQYGRTCVVPFSTAMLQSL
jgi:hypothetical protein